MIDKDSIEKALLLGIVKTQNWRVLILNNITEEYFSPANRSLYRYIKDYADRNKYPDLKIISYEFNIDDIAMAEYTSITDLDSLCETLHNTYVKDKLQFEVGKLILVFSLVTKLVCTPSFTSSFSNILKLAKSISLFLK